MIAHGLQKWGTYTVITTCGVVCRAVNLRQYPVLPELYHVCSVTCNSRWGYVTLSRSMGRLSPCQPR